MKNVIILAAGEGHRIKNISLQKPITKINNQAMIELLIASLNKRHQFQYTIIFNENGKLIDFTKLKLLQNSNVHYFFKNTISSMHSLSEALSECSLDSNETHILISMVDSIVHSKDMNNFINLSMQLNKDESAVLVSRFIDDEKPLTLNVNQDGYIKNFDVEITKDTFATSGVYCLSLQTIPLLNNFTQLNKKHMREFFKHLLTNQHKIKTLIVDKTIDVDHPRDILTASLFLNEEI